MINRLRRGFDPGFLVVLLICWLAVWPLISRASLPEGTDAELHIFRLHELSYLIRGGEFYPRWAPDFYHGYGYPIFNYYAPLTYYLALPLELLPRIDAVAATKVVLVVGMLAAGLGMYGYGRDSWGRRAGFVAAALYVYSPYLQYIDPHIRGALPEAFSFGVFPLALWALDRLRRRPTVGSWVAASVLTAAVILSHNLMGLFFFGLLAAWVAWQAVVMWLDNRPPDQDVNDVGILNRNVIARLASAMFIGLALAAFFWVPVILERNAVTLGTLIGAGDNYDFRTHFVSLRELLGFSSSPDWGATQSPFLFNLGVAQWVAGLVGAVMLVTRRARAREQLTFFAIAAVVIGLLMTSLSRPLWEAIPFLPYFQFPWRLLGAAVAMLAILGAAGTESVARWWGPGKEAVVAAHRSAWLYAAVVAIILLLALPLSQPMPWKPFGEVNTLRMSLIENSGRWLGTTSTADYVPATVITLPPRRGSVVAPIERGEAPDRVNHEAMPAGAEVVTEVVRPLMTRYHVTAPKQFRLRLYQFDFPGWHVTVDGQPAVTELAEPEGFIVILVPQGQHTVEVRFGSTWPRSMGWGMTLVGLLLLGLGGWSLRGAQSPGRPIEFLRGRAFIHADWPIIASTGALTFAVLLLQPLGLFHHDSQGRELDFPATEQTVNFGDQIALLGYNGTIEVASPGDVLDLSLYWQAQRPLEIDYQSFVHVIDSSGELVAQSDKLNPGEFPTSRWPIDKYVPDRHQIRLPDDLPPGVYSVLTGIWVQSEGWRLAVFDARGQPVGDRQELFEFRVE
ncbi:MAG: hypothetical protein KC410_09575 [Anaerolineales bacterium]|uniref:6-pyruvoyl-tetrahydropterin synthase-related protein n=1 Tax=Promineifilum sp. TaxID=2664178 RepID=UPI001D5E2276|nr:hypothetical protein [Anaerolineales bacterium]MCB8934553.1 hypothetical protein [Promineifilum sp.]MCO5179067.1 6-pyruvoyl-tetrahydropterin synthase-related protein [Promineifilum sp.]